MAGGIVIPVNFVGSSRSAVAAAQQVQTALTRAGASAGTYAREQRVANNAAAGGARSFGGLKSTVLGLAGAYVGTVGLMYAVRGVVDEEKQMQAVNAQTRAALASTHGVAGVTTKKIQDLGEEIMRLSGIDDEQVRAAENVVLMFDQVRDVAGKNNDIFTQTIRLAADLAKRLGQDVTGTARTLGRALQDPLRGMTQLRRANIILVQSEQDAIRAAVAHGDILKAQQIILGRVRIQVGGAAEAYGKTLPGQIDRSREALRNWGRDVLGNLSVSGDFADSIEKWASNSKNAESAANALRAVVKALKLAIDAARTVFDGINKVTGGWENTLKLIVALKLVSFFGGVTQGIGGMAGKLGGADGAVGLSGKLLANMQGLMKIGVLAIGVTTFFAGMKNTGVKGFMEAMLGGAAVGWVVGGPYGALATVTLAVSLKVLPNIPKWLQDLLGGEGKFNTQVMGQQADAFMAQLRAQAATKEGVGVAWLKEHIAAMKELGNTSNDTYRVLAQLLEMVQAKGKNAKVTLKDVVRAVTVVGRASVPSPGGSLAGRSIVGAARDYGVGSGGVYKWGGGHGGVVRPGTALDCSGYAWQVFTAAGFKGFPGDSYSQWSTDKGSNWTSVQIPISQAKPGDLAFTNWDGRGPGHVGVVVGGSGMSATVMQYYRSDLPANIVKMPMFAVPSNAGKIGVKRFALVGQETRRTTASSGPGAKPPGSGKPPPPTAKDITQPSVGVALLLATAQEAFALHPGAKTLSALAKVDDAAIAELNKRMAKATKKQKADLIKARTAYEQEKKQAATEIAQKSTDVAELPYAQGRALKLAQTAAENHPAVKTIQALIDADTKAIGTLKARQKKASVKQRQELQDAIDALVAARDKSRQDLKALTADLAKPVEEARTSLYGALEDALGKAPTFKLGTLAGEWVAKLAGFAPRIETLGPLISDAAKKAGQKLEAAFEKLTPKNWKALSPAGRRQVQLDIEKWGQMYADGLEAAARTLDRAIQHASDAVTQSFDDATDAYEEAWNDDTAKTLDDMREKHQQMVDELQVAVTTQWGTFTYGANGKTPAELMLDQLRAAREVGDRQWNIEQARQVLAEATAKGDAKAAQAAQRDLNDALQADQEAQLEDRAEVERSAAEKRLTDEQKALDKRLTKEEEAYEKGRAALLKAWDRNRAAQRTKLMEDLSDWEWWLDTKQKSLQAFYDWVAAQGVTLPASPASTTTSTWVDAAASAAGVTIAQAIEQGIIRSLPRGSATAIAFAEGGTVPGTYVGRADTVSARLTAGEEVIDRRLAADLRAFLANPRSGTNYYVFNGHVWDRKELVAELKRQIDTSGEWRPGGATFGAR